MIAANYGRIVNVSSVAGKEGNPKEPAYSAMKAAVMGLTKSLGKELAGYNIGVNCVTPAVAKTTLALSQAPDFLAMIVSKIPRGRMLELTRMAEKAAGCRHPGLVGMVRRNRKARGWSSCDVAVVVHLLVGITALIAGANLNARVIAPPYRRRARWIGAAALIAAQLIPA